MLGPRDRAPDFALGDAEDRLVILYELDPGRPVHLAFVPTLDRGPEELSHLADQLAPDTLTVITLDESVPETPLTRVLVDDGDVTQAFLGPQPADPGMVVRLDANYRVSWVGLLGEPLPPEVPETGLTPAPVLVVNDVVDPWLVERLLELALTADFEPSGMPSEDGLVVDPRAKLRADLLLEGELHDRLAAQLQQRLLPEVARCFHHDITNFERLKLVRYEPGGLFAPHRDNSAEAVAHRRFAVTLNLNADFEGGGLVFAEHQPDEHRPPPGGAVVFSGALQHRVQPVTSGTRYALITFLW